MFQKRTLIIAFVIIALGLALGTFFFRSNHKRATKKAEATLNTAIITTQADWETMTRSNIDTSSAGSIKINDKTLTYTEVSLTGKTITTTSDEANGGNVIDENLLTTWNPVYPFTDSGNPLPGAPVITGSWKVDLGENVEYISKYAASCNNVFNAGSYIYYSSDDSSYTLLDNEGEDPPGGGMYEKTFSQITARYFRIDRYAYVDMYPITGQNEFHIYTATGNAELTAQIDGGENFWEWEDFTPTDTEPPNTSITYRYRSSANGADWNAWHNAIGDVESRSGDTKYRYLQVEATLSNTDGASTPTIDSYDINYHTEVKPTAPSAETATTQ
jgi:hypothetical protein